jgi:DNA polymerase-3 subunit beta
MNAVVEKNVLEKALAKAAATISGKKTLPVLSGVRLEVLHGKLSVSAYDLETAYEATLDVLAASPGKALVDAVKAAAIVRALPEGPVELHATSRQLVVTSGSAEFKLGCLDLEQYPAPPAVPEDGVAVDGKHLAAQIDAVVYAVSKDDTRYNLCGVFMQTSEGRLTLVSSDGHRLAKAESAWTGPEIHGAIVPTKAVRLLGALLDDKAGAVTLRVADRMLALSVGTETITARLIDGQFPRWQSVVPTIDVASGKWTVERKKLLEVLRRVLLVAPAVKVDLDKRLLSSQDPDVGDMHEALPGDFEGKGFTFGVNGGYVTEALAALEDETVTVFVWDDLSPIVVQGTDRLHVVMPMRI